MSLPRARCQLHDMASLRALRRMRPSPRPDRPASSMSLEAFGDADVVLVGHAAHAVAEGPHEIKAGLDESVVHR